MKILTLNCGSSSVKYAIFNWDRRETLCKGVIERVGTVHTYCVHEVNGKEKQIINQECDTHMEAVKLILRLVASPLHGVIKNINEIDAVGHRVLHGGEKITKSVIIDENKLDIFKELKDLGPLHNPANIMGIEAAKDLLPNVPHMAVMDTAFHQTMKPEQFMYAVPYEWYDNYQIRRYGFHGTSHLYVSKRAAVLLGKDPSEVNVITLHVGNGVSLTAVKNGVSFDTSMGLTPLEGLIMGTRAGDHDPALTHYIMEKEGLSVSEVDNILNKKSGLLGVTGRYSDRRDVIEAMEKGDERAQLALEMECYRIKKYIGSYAAALGRVDAIIWTAGVGEMSPLIRAKAMEGLEESIGIKFDPHKNDLAKSRNAEFDITGSHAKTKVFVIPTDEELVFVEDVVALLENRYDTYTHFRYSFEDPQYRNKMRDIEFQKELRKSPEMAAALAQVPWEYEVRTGLRRL